MKPMVGDLLAVDWECVPAGPYLENIGAKRITLLKIKEGTSAADMKFLHDSIQLLPSKYITNLKHTTALSFYCFDTQTII